MLKLDLLSEVFLVFTILCTLVERQYASMAFPSRLYGKMDTDAFNCPEKLMHALSPYFGDPRLYLGVGKNLWCRKKYATALKTLPPCGEFLKMDDMNFGCYSVSQFDKLTVVVSSGVVADIVNCGY